MAKNAQLPLRFDRPPLNGRDGWVLVEFTRFWADSLIVRQGPRLVVGPRKEILRLTYENYITCRRRTIERDVSNTPNSKRVLKIGFISKRRFNAMANELGEARARRICEAR